MGYADDSVSTWTHLIGTAEGVDSGSFTFVCDSNTTGLPRLDSLEIYAPETDSMVKVVYILQTDEAPQAVIAPVVDEVRVYPNPVRKSVTVEGPGIKSVRILSAVGKETARYRLDAAESLTLDMSAMPAGFYILEVETLNGMVYKKVLKTL